jgi:hypothetical protein
MAEANAAGSTTLPALSPRGDSNPRTSSTLRSTTDCLPLPPLLASHAHMVGRLMANTPHRVSGHCIADARDLDDRAEHIRILLRAFGQYIREAVKDIESKSNHRFDFPSVEAYFDDLAGDVAGQMEYHAETIREGLAA